MAGEEQQQAVIGLQLGELVDHEGAHRSLGGCLVEQRLGEELEAELHE